jgi:hypothetical protein
MTRKRSGIRRRTLPKRCQLETQNSMKATFGAASVKVFKSRIEFDLIVLVKSLQLLQNAHVSDLVVPELYSKQKITKLSLSQHQLLPISSLPPCT